MKNKKLLLLISLITGLSLILVIYFMSADKSIRAEVSAHKTGRSKILYYQAPMDPTYISDKPGKSPMGMDLIPVYEGEQAAEGGVRIDPATVQNIGVRTELVQRRNLSREIRTVGRIDYDERKIAYINTKVGGWIEKLYVDYTGQSVEECEKLLDIYSPELVATQEEYLLALEYSRQLQQSKFAEVSNRARTLLESSRKRLQYWDISDEQIERLEQSGQVNKTLTIHSPTKGIVIHKNALEGKYTKPGENLYKIADISRIWVYADIYEYELPWVKVGQEAEMSLSYLPGKIFKGKVTYLYPYLESKTRTVKVRMEFDNPEWELKPEMYVDVKIKTVSRDGVAAVPREAVIHSGERKVIIIDKGKGLFEPRDIVLGQETNDYYEAISGVEAGERVVISSQFLIDSESKLKEAIAKMLEAKSPKAGPPETLPLRHQQVRIKDSTRKTMEQVWRHYFNIRKSLSQDSLANVEQQARAIQKNLRTILATDESEAMRKLAKDILESANELYLKDIVRSRADFLNLSKGMIKYMKEFDRQNSRAKKYKLFFCGMEQRYWVQNEEAIGNPYLGAAMSNCGISEDY